MYVVRRQEKYVCYISYHAHVWRVFLELPVHNEVDALRYEKVLELWDVLWILVTILCQATHFGPTELLQNLQVNVAENKNTPIGKVIDFW